MKSSKRRSAPPKPQKPAQAKSSLSPSEKSRVMAKANRILSGKGG